MRIATILGIAVLGMSGVAVAQVGSTPAEQQSDQATTNTTTVDNGVSSDDMSTDDSMSAPDNATAPDDGDTSTPDNTMTPPGL